MSTSHALTRARRGSRIQRGFSLMEVLVGMLIAMVGVVIMMEVLLTSEQRTRTTGTGNDALSSGAIILHMMKKDLVQAGYGLNSQNIIGCNVVVPTGAAVPLAPVVINPPTALVPAGDANTDRLLVFYGNDPGQPEGNEVFGVDAGAKTYSMQAPTSFNDLDWVVAVPATCAGNLTLARVPVTGISALDIKVSVVEPTARFVYNMGSNPRVIAYAVRNGSLTSCNFMVNDCRNLGPHWVSVASDIVSLKAQYGRDTAPAGSMDGFVDQWTTATPTTTCEWVRSSAIRLAIVSRSTQFESRIDPGTGQRVAAVVTANAPIWSGTTVSASNPTAAPIDLSKKPDGSSNPDWQAYRYRMLETVAPTRNIVWMGATTGC
jgi:type IV pilus assembly protein PilW